VHPPDLLEVVRPDLADMRLAAHGRIITTPDRLRGGPLREPAAATAARFLRGPKGPFFREGTTYTRIITAPGLLDRDRSARASGAREGESPRRVVTALRPTPA